MIFNTLGDIKNPAILFFHAMGVTGESSLPVANYLKDNYYCIMPTSTVYCEGQKYISKQDELQQVVNFIKEKNIDNIKMLVASSLGADLAMEFLTKSNINVEHVFFDGGQFAQINKTVRVIMTPFMYLAIKSLYWSKGKTLKQILWCDDENIKPYFIKAGKNLTFNNLFKQLRDSLENKPFPPLSIGMQKKIFFEFGSIEDHYKYRENVVQSYPNSSYPVFDKFNHMQLQIKDPKEFANMLTYIISTNNMPELSFCKNE